MWAGCSSFSMHKNVKHHRGGLTAFWSANVGGVLRGYKHNRGHYPDDLEVGYQCLHLWCIDFLRYVFSWDRGWMEDEGTTLVSAQFDVALKEPVSSVKAVPARISPLSLSLSTHSLKTSPALLREIQHPCDAALRLVCFWSESIVTVHGVKVRQQLDVIIKMEASESSDGLYTRYS